MKAAITQVAAGTGNKDFTDANISSDFKGAILFGNSATANGSTVANARLSLGLVDADSARSVSIAAQDNQATTVVAGDQVASAYKLSNPNGGTSALASFGSVLSNGLRINFSTAAVGYLVNALMLSGTDVTTQVSSVTLQTGTAPVTTTVTHGGTTDPDIVIAVGYLGSQEWSHGFYDRAGNKYATVSYSNLTGQGACDISCYVSNNAIIRQISNNAVQYACTIGNFSDTTFDLTTTGTPIEGDTITFLCIWVTDGAFKVGIASTPTATGNSTIVTGMGKSPNVLMMMPTRIDTVNSFAVTDPGAGHHGFCAIVDNEGVTQQYSSSMTSDEGADPTVEKCWSSNTKGLVILNTAGAVLVDASLATWDSGGVTLNFSTVDSTSYLVPYLAISGRAGAVEIIPPEGFDHTLVDARDITAITKANPCAVTVADGHNLTTGAVIRIWGVGGMTELNHNEFTITVTSSTVFTLDGIDSTGYTTFTSGGFVSFGLSILEYADSPVNDGDIIEYSTTSTPGGYNVVVRADGGFTVQAGGDQTRQQFQAKIYGDEDYVNFTINNSDPTFPPSGYTWTVNVAISAINFQSAAQDADGDTPTVQFLDGPGGSVVTDLDSLIPGMDYTAGVITGTPTQAGLYSQWIRVTDGFDGQLEKVVNFNVQSANSGGGTSQGLGTGLLHLMAFSPTTRNKRY